MDIVEFTPFDAAAILIVLAATLSYVNYRLFRMPFTIGMTIMGAVASLVVVGLDRVLPGSQVGEQTVAFLAGIDFHKTLMDGMLSFLLFAGALHVNWAHMRRGRWPILVLSTVGVLISTILIGAGFFLLCRLLGFEIPLLWCMVFGSLVSPTDPVAVMGILQRTDVPPTLKATVAGESLFNDGVGVVVFTILFSAALGTRPFSLGSAGHLFLVEAGGGLLIGFIVGWIAFRAMRSIDEYKTEVMISLAVVMGGYTLASWLHVSGPIAMAVAGLLIGNQGVAHAMSDVTRDYVIKFWALIDDILNAVLFLLIGLEVVLITTDPRLLLIGALAIPLAVATRAVAVFLPLRAMRSVLDLGPLAPITLIWGGLRGGISIALALSLPKGPVQSVALASTYAIVLFSVIVQGGTIERVLGFVQRRRSERRDE
jgi:monovalent cation:H+ antiporter, CPA1 family